MLLHYASAGKSSCMTATSPTIHHIHSRREGAVKTCLPMPRGNTAVR